MQFIPKQINICPNYCYLGYLDISETTNTVDDRTKSQKMNRCQNEIYLDIYLDIPVCKNQNDFRSIYNETSD